MNLLVLVDSKEFYGVDRSIDDALALIADIPSVTLVNYLSGFQVNLYLNENSDQTTDIQIHLLNNLVVKAGQETVDKCKEVYARLQSNNHKPVFFYSHSNLHFYDLVFTNYNNLPLRDLTDVEAKIFSMLICY